MTTSVLDTAEAIDTTTASDRAVYTVLLAKEDFKFSSGHFTLFGPDEAELMHGHNYRVQVELEGTELDEEEILVNFYDTKREIRSLCEHLDTRTLVPTKSRHLEIEEDDGHIEVRFKSRRYVLPAGDVLLLPLANTTVEAFARYLWQQLVERLELGHLDRLGVAVGETDGQSCWYRAPLP